MTSCCGSLAVTQTLMESRAQMDGGGFRYPGEAGLKCWGSRGWQNRHQSTLAEQERTIAVERSWRTLQRNLDGTWSQNRTLQSRLARLFPEPAAINIDSLIGSEEETKESVEDFVNQITERQPAEPALNSLNENIELLADLALKDRDRYSR